MNRCPFVCISVCLPCAKRILTSRNKTPLSFRKDLGKHVDPAHLLYNPFIQVVCRQTCKATIIGAPYPQGNLFKGDVFLVIHQIFVKLFLLKQKFLTSRLIALTKFKRNTSLMEIQQSSQKACVSMLHCNQHNLKPNVTDMSRFLRGCC